MPTPICSFYEKNVYPPLSRLWGRVPSPPSTKKVALCALCIFGLYAIYRTYQSLQERVNQATNTPKPPVDKRPGSSNKLAEEENNSNPQETPESPTHQNISLSIEPAEPKIGTHEGEKKSDTPNSDSTSKEEPQSEREEDYFSCEESLDEKVSTDSVTPLSDIESSSSDEKADPPLPTHPVAILPNSPPLEVLKKQFPGAGLQCTVEGIQITFANFILERLLKINLVSECKKSGEDTYQLTYPEKITATFSKLPGEVPTRISWIVKSVLNAPVTFQNPMTIQIVEDNDFHKVIFNEGIEATKQVGYAPFSTTYTAYLEGIYVYKRPQEDETIFVKVRHDVALLKKFQGKSGPHQGFVDLLHSNLST